MDEKQKTKITVEAFCNIAEHGNAILQMIFNAYKIYVKVTQFPAITFKNFEKVLLNGRGKLDDNKRKLCSQVVDIIMAHANKGDLDRDNWREEIHQCFDQWGIPHITYGEFNNFYNDLIFELLQDDNCADKIQAAVLLQIANNSATKEDVEKILKAIYEDKENQILTFEDVEKMLKVICEGIENQIKQIPTQILTLLKDMEKILKAIYEDKENQVRQIPAPVLTFERDLEHRIKNLSALTYIDQKISLLKNEFTITASNAYDEVNKIFETMSEEKQSNREAARHLCIYGPGGYGKTTLLLQIAKAYREKKKKVLYIRMSMLDNDIISDKSTTRSDDVIEALKAAQQNDEETIFLLDGFNETNFNKISKKILNDLKEIISSIKICEHFKIICTSRTKIKELTNYSSAVLKELDEETIKKQLKNCGIDPELLDSTTFKLIMSPLYLSIYIRSLKLNQNQNKNYCTRYDLLEARFRKTKEGSEVYGEEDTCSFDEREIIYQYILPVVSYQLWYKSKFDITISNARNYVNKYLSLLKSSKIAIDRIDNYLFTQNITEENMFNYLFEKTVSNMGIFVDKDIIDPTHPGDPDDLVHTYFHQDIRDFFCAYYIKKNINYFENKEIDVSLDFYADLSKLDSDLISFIIEGLLHISLKATTQEKCEKYESFVENHLSHFAKRNPLEANGLAPSRGLRVAVFLSQIGHELFAEEINKLKLYDPTVRESLSKYKEEAKRIIEYADSWIAPDVGDKEIIKDQELVSQVLLEIYTFVAQLFRNFHDYENCLQVAERMEEIAPDCADAFHHQGKAYLYNFWGLAVKHDTTRRDIQAILEQFPSPEFLVKNSGNDNCGHEISYVLTDAGKKAAYQLVTNGICYLQKAVSKGSITAMNLLGMFHFTPPPQLEEYLPKDFVDVCKAFEMYSRSAMSANKNTGLCAYAKLQCVSMLLKRKVTLRSSLPDVQKIQDNEKDSILTPDSLRKAQQYLEETERYSLNFWHYYKGRLLEEVGRQLQREKLPNDLKDLFYEKYKLEDYLQYFEEAYHQYDIEGDKLPCNSRRQLLIVEGLVTKNSNEFSVLESKNRSILEKGFPVKEVEDFSGKYIKEEYEQEKNLIEQKLKIKSICN